MKTYRNTHMVKLYCIISVVSIVSLLFIYTNNLYVFVRVLYLLCKILNLKHIKIGNKYKSVLRFKQNMKYLQTQF